MLILGIESSCDETSIAIVEDGKTVLSNIIASQIEVHKLYGGVVPEIASRYHIEDISYVLEACLKEANKKISDIDYIAVTNKPGLIGSLLVGIMFAKGLSYRYNIPLIPVNHLEGHIYSTFLHQEINLPATVVVASGGHTCIYSMDRDHNLELLGETLDDAIGEAYDKVARMVGLPYPGGPSIEKNGVGGENTLNIPIPNVDGYNLSFSGIKTYVTNYINKCKLKDVNYSIKDICKSFEIAAVEHLKRKIIKACMDTESKSIVIAGGVSANKHLRNELYNDNRLQNIEVKFPIKMEYCTDNGAMVASSAYYNLKYKNKIDNTFDAMSTKELHRK